MLTTVLKKDSLTLEGDAKELGAVIKLLYLLDNPALIV